MEVFNDKEAFFLKIHLLLFLFIFSTFSVHADELHLIISGKSFHINPKQDWNENNHGLGFEYDFNSQSNWTPLFTGASIKDSNNQTSNYIGGGVKYNVLDKNDFFISLGGIIFYMTRKDYQDNKPFLGAIPFISIGYQRVSTNITYVPDITGTMDAAIYLQLLIKILDF